MYQILANLAKLRGKMKKMQFWLHAQYSIDTIQRPLLAVENLQKKCKWGSFSTM